MGDEARDKWLELLANASAIDPDEGGDLVGDTWIALADRLNLDVDYLLGAARNIRRNRDRRDRRRTHREQQWTSAYGAADLDPCTQLERAELLAALERALDRLNATELRLLHDRYVAGKSSRQIAAGDPATANTIRWRLKTLVDRLRTLLTEYLEPSMTPDREVRVLVRSIERCLESLTDAWTGRLVIHLEPSPASTNVERLDFIPPAPPGLRAQLQRQLKAESLPGCSVTGRFEMHFECNAT